MRYIEKISTVTFSNSSYLMIVFNQLESFPKISKELLIEKISYLEKKLAIGELHLMLVILKNLSI